MSSLEGVSMWLESRQHQVQILLLTTLKDFPGLQERSLPLPETARDVHFSALDEVLTVLVRDMQIVPELQGSVKNIVAGSPTLEESNLSQEGDDPRAVNEPKETRPHCRTTAGPTARTTPLLRDAQKP